MRLKDLRIQMKHPSIIPSDYKMLTEEMIISAGRLSDGGTPLYSQRFRLTVSLESGGMLVPV